jgi:NodT family efflux transporter outer membrane factor (OMF) lipoprotein
MKGVPLAIAVVALVAGCTPVGPDYERPTLEAGTGYRAPVPELVGAAAAETDWWRQFDDPLVPELIDRALAANLDLQAAESRIREAQALRRSVRSDRFPTLDAEAGADIGYTRRLRGEESSDPQAGASGGGVVGWTADLFGGQRRAEQAAAAQAARAVWLRQAVALDVAGEVATTYVDLRGLERRLVLGEDSLALQQRTLQIVRGRVDAGLAPALDLSRAQAAVSRLTADLVPIRTDIRLASDTIATLLGQPPSAVALPPSTIDGAIPRLSAGPAIGLPADLIRRRPDLRAAEFALIAATAEIGVAEAELYPELTLPGRLTLSVNGLGTGDIVGTVIAALSATLDIPVFDAGGRQARVDAAEERARQALLSYRASLLSALAEVEAAMQRYAGAQERVAALDATVAANRRAVEQAQALYGGGLVNFIDVLDSQRDLTVSLQQRAAARADLTRSAIALYRAAGFAPCPILGTDPIACPESQSVG